MQDLDDFISPTPSFEGDVSIPAIPILACDPSTEPSEELLSGSSASTPRTQACKRKATINLNPPKNANEIAGEPLGGIKIIHPKSKAPASTPPSRTRKGIPILRSKRYVHHKSIFIAHC
jgi:hypothetical protein